MLQRASIAIMILVIGLSGTHAAVARRSVVPVPPNLMTEFQCSPERHAPLQETLEFLRNLGFESRDMGREGRHEFEVLAIDQQRRMLAFIGPIGVPYAFAAAVYMPPSMRGSTDLEEALVALISNQLACRVTWIKRTDYGEDEPVVNLEYNTTFEFVEHLVRGGNRDDWDVGMR